MSGEWRDHSKCSLCIYCGGIDNVQYNGYQIPCTHEFLINKVIGGVYGEFMQLYETVAGSGHWRPEDPYYDNAHCAAHPEVIADCEEYCENYGQLGSNARCNQQCVLCGGPGCVDPHGECRDAPEMPNGCRRVQPPVQHARNLLSAPGGGGGAEQCSSEPTGSFIL